MGLESADYISQLVTTNPVGATDPKEQGDDHLRLIKHVLQTQFPNLGAAAVNATAAEINRLVGVTDSVESMRGMAYTSQAAPYAIAAGDIGKFVNISSAGTITLGNLAQGFACLISATGGNLTLTSSSGDLLWQAGGGVAAPAGNLVLRRSGIVTVYRDGTNWRAFGIGLTT